METKRDYKICAPCNRRFYTKIVFEMHNKNEHPIDEPLRSTSSLNVRREKEHQLDESLKSTSRQNVQTINEHPIDEPLNSTSSPNVQREKEHQLDESAEKTGSSAKKSQQLLTEMPKVYSNIKNVMEDLINEEKENISQSAELPILALKCKIPIDSKTDSNDRTKLLNKVFACDTCEQCFDSNSKVENHFRIVHQERELQGQKCEKSLGNNSQLKIQTKKDSKPFQCRICQKVFSLDKRLQRHTKVVHEEIKPFQCDVCHKSFGYKISLKYHIGIVHHPTKPVTCQVCQKSFSCSRYLTVHTKAVHDKVKLFQCEKCPKNFIAKRSLILHTQAVHKK